MNFVEVEDNRTRHLKIELKNGSGSVTVKNWSEAETKTIYEHGSKIAATVTTGNWLPLESSRLQELVFADGEVVNSNQIQKIIDTGSLGSARASALNEMQQTSVELPTFDGFESKPVVFSQIVTNNDATFAVTRMGGINTKDFHIRLQESESENNSARGTETVSFIAMESGQHLSANIGNTGNVVTHNWSNTGHSYKSDSVLLADMQTFHGSDTGSLRHKVHNGNIYVRIEEERSKDHETYHIKEDVGYGLFSSGEILNIDGDIIGYAGSIKNLFQPAGRWHTVDLDVDFKDMVVVMGPPSSAGPDHSFIRLNGIDNDNDQFEFILNEWTGDGVHYYEDYNYLVLEAGNHHLSDGTVVVADNVEVDHVWKEVLLPQDDAFLASFDQNQTLH